MTSSPALQPNGTAAPFGVRVPAHRTPEGVVHILDVEPRDVPDLPPAWVELDEGYGDAGFTPSPETRTATLTVSAVATPKLVGVFTDEQARTLAEAAFDLATTGVNSGRVWIVRNQIDQRPELRDSEIWMFEESEAVIAWADFECGDPDVRIGEL